MKHEVWQHGAPGRPVILIGAAVPPAPAALETIRVICGQRREPLGVWRSAGDEARRRLGLAPRAVDGRGRIAARGVLLGAQESDPMGDVVADLNRLYAWRPFHLVLDRLDAADPPSLQALGRLLVRPEWLRAPLVLGFLEQPGPRFAPLLERVEAIGGALLTALPAAPVLLLPDALPPESRRVLRAAAVMGQAVAVDVLAALLDAPPIEVLEAFQLAADAGVPVEDDGAGHLHLPRELVDTLRDGTLPSLSRAWHARLAALLQPAAPASEAPAASAPPSPVEFVDELPADLAAQGWSDGAEADDPIAEHLLAAGDAGAAVDRLLVAMDEALAVGAADEALALADQARRHLDRQPPTGAVRRQRVALLTAVARAQYHAVGPHHALDVAHATAEAAVALLRPGDPPALRARLDTLRARILYDQGSPAALDAALAILTDCARWLEAHDAPREAARLFNDQAAIWVRMGDVVRAHHLLEASRAVFAEHAAGDDTATLELAETDHLIARLPLHVAARPGRGDDAIELGLTHGRSAAEAYARLAMPREQARVWSTLGRLELARGATEEALDQLRRTAQRQQQLGDALGLADTVEALAETMAAAGAHLEALGLLRDSLALNAEKGSAQGLDRTVAILAQFEGALPADAQRELSDGIAALRADLALAREHLGA